MSALYQIRGSLSYAGKRKNLQMLVIEDGQLRPVLEPQFIQDVADIIAHGAVAQVHLFRDLLVIQPVGQQGDQLIFFFRDVKVFIREIPFLLEQVGYAGDDLLSKYRLVLTDGVQGRDDAGVILFQQVSFDPGL